MLIMKGNKKQVQQSDYFMQSLLEQENWMSILSFLLLLQLIPVSRISKVKWKMGKTGVVVWEEQVNVIAWA